MDITTTSLSQRAVYDSDTIIQATATLANSTRRAAVLIHGSLLVLVLTSASDMGEIGEMEAIFIDHVSGTIIGVSIYTFYSSYQLTNFSRRTSVSLRTNVPPTVTTLGTSFFLMRPPSSCFVSVKHITRLTCTRFLDPTTRLRTDRLHLLLSQCQASNFPLLHQVHYAHFEGLAALPRFNQGIVHNRDISTIWTPSFISRL